MPYLQLNDRQFALRVGETRVGGGTEVEVPVPGSEPMVQAIVDLSRDSHVSIRRASAGALVKVNGVQLGAEPTPLIHGDKIEVGGAELFYGDDRKGGSTQFISSVNLPDFHKLRGPAPGKATLATGGRVISLVDGREYTIASSGLTFGRDAACDVVIPSSEVSRRHAEISPGDVGYVISDTSTNGIWVNGERVDAMQVLGRGDVVRMGSEEFRFYADAQAPAKPAASDAAAPSVPAAGPLVPAAPVAVAPVAVAPMALAAAPIPEAPAPPLAPAAAAQSSRPPLATFEVVGDSALKGQQFAVISVLANVGRGAHNDVVIVEESVSDSHAKLQRREGVWYVTDLGSTNGTYLGGRRIESEERLQTDADLRFGGVPVVFRASDVEPITGPKVGGTRQINVDAVRRAAPAAVPAPAASAPVSGLVSSAPRERRVPAPQVTPVRQPKARIPWWVWVAVLVVVAAAAAVALRMR